MVTRAALALFFALSLTPPAAADELTAQERVQVEDHIRVVLRDHMQACWQAPANPTDRVFVVTMQFELSEDGSLAGQPRVTDPRNYTFNPSMREAVAAAMRAVRACAPYPFPRDPIAAEHYDLWREIEMAFGRRS